MAEAGDAATEWISCDLMLVNATQFMLASNGDFSVSSVRRIEVLAELDTGCRHLGLPTQQILELQPLGDSISHEQRATNNSDIWAGSNRIRWTK
ncbi:unnamed protein product, partial [Didymodactylos carnosus]